MQKDALNTLLIILMNDPKSGSLKNEETSRKGTSRNKTLLVQRKMWHERKRQSQILKPKSI